VRVSRITVDRLFNLGNFEHVKFSVSVDIEHGDSAARAFTGLKKVMNALNPKRPGNVPTNEDSLIQMRELGRMRDMSDTEHRRMHAGYVGTREEYQNRILQGIQEGITRREKWEEGQKRARAFLDDIGGAADYHDAKLGWDQDTTDY
jgi:hypothetical protein